jgi:AcrR family transcriptional regulator
MRFRMHDADSVVVEQIVEAARGYFLRFGYSRVSTEEIARSIGRSKKTLYKHFETKEALLRAVLIRVDGEAQHEIARRLAEPCDDRLGRLRCVLTAVARHMASTHAVLLADLRVCSPDLGQQAWRERRQALGLLLEPVLREAAAAGVMRQDVACDQVLAVFFSCVEGLNSSTEDVAQGQASGERFETLVSLLVDGLRQR